MRVKLGRTMMWNVSVGAACLLAMSLKLAGADLRGEPTGRAAATRVPTFTEVARAVDLRRVAIPDDAALNDRRVGSYSVVLQRDVPATLAFVREQMQQLGCKEIASDNPANPPHVYLAFEREGSKVTAVVSPEPTSGGSNIYLRNLGPLDPRQLPRMPEAEPHLASRDSVVLYTSTAIPAAVAATRQAFAAAEWHEVPRGKEPGEGTKQAFLTFFQRGAKAEVYLAPAHDKAGMTAIHYQSAPMEAELPLPPHAVAIKFSPFPGDRLACQSAEPLKAVAEFYQEYFTKLGWSEVPKMTKTSEKSALFMFRNDNDVTTVSLSTKEGQTQVNLTGLINKMAADEKQAIERRKVKARSKN